MKRIFLLTLLPIIATAAYAEPQVTLLPDAVLCFQRSDWKEMIAAGTDQDTDAMQRLVDEGKCRINTKAVRVGYIDPASGTVGSIIQLPSGKTAFTADNFIKR